MHFKYITQMQGHRLKLHRIEFRGCHCESGPEPEFCGGRRAGRKLKDKLFNFLKNSNDYIV